MVRSKLPNISTSIFTIVTELANKHKALNLAQGFPDFSPPEELISLVEQNMRKGNNQYAPMQGLMKLREKIAEKTESLYGNKYNPDSEITITSGATEAIFSTISAFIQEGDEVIVFEPAYDSYAPVIKINGGNPIYVGTKLPDFRIDWDEVNKMVNSRTKMIIINSPHNPSGSILSLEGMERLNKLVAGTNILILSDEVYEHLIYDGSTHESLAKFPNLKERAIIISSFGKTYNATGWKLGYCLASESNTKEIRKIHQFNVFCVNTPLQYAVAEFIDKKDAYLELSAFYQQKRDEFLAMIKGSRFTFTPSQGTYFQLLNFKDISDEKDADFSNRLIKEYKLAAIPVSAFYHNAFDSKDLRFCFAKSTDTLKKAAEILHSIK